MNVYIIVEGNTESKVYPEWLAHLAPGIVRKAHPSELADHSYYLFNAGGIPSIYRHIAHAIEDINSLIESGVRIDFLLVCIDTEQESRSYILEQIDKTLKEEGVGRPKCPMLVFEQRVSMESWFLANRKVFKSNPEDRDLIRFIEHYNVRTDDPELMDTIDPTQYATKAQFHNTYLRKIFKERKMTYSKSNPKEVCKRHYLDEIIDRYKESGHIPSFGRWYEFVKSHLT